MNHKKAEDEYEVGRCHDCGNPTFNYRCPLCKKLHLMKHGIEPSSINSVNEDFAAVGGLMSNTYFVNRGKR